MTLAFEDRREQSCLAATPNCRPAVACLVHATFVKHLSCQRPVLASICKIVFRVSGEGKSFCAEHLTELTANLTGKPSQSWIGDWWEGRRVACLVSDLNGLTQSQSCPRRLKYARSDSFSCAQNLLNPSFPPRFARSHLDPPSFALLHAIPHNFAQIRKVALSLAQTRSIKFVICIEADPFCHIHTRTDLYSFC